MASPTYTSQGTASQSASATSRASIVLPTRSNGDLLICVCCSKNNATHTWTGTGWAKFDQVNSGASFTVSLAYCIVDGTEAAPSVSWSGAVACGARIYSWTGAAVESPYASLANGSNTGSGTTHSKTGVTTTQTDSRVIYIDVCGVNTALATPSGWTENIDSAFATTVAQFTVGGKDIATSGTASGDISVTGGNSDWVMWQIELRSPVSGGPWPWFTDSSLSGGLQSLGGF